MQRAPGHAHCHPYRQHTNRTIAASAAMVWRFRRPGRQIIAACGAMILTSWAYVAMQTPERAEGSTAPSEPMHEGREANSKQGRRNVAIAVSDAEILGATPTP